MRYVMINEATPGMKLAKNIYDLASRVLISEHQELTEEYIEKLRYRGYSGFYIEDEYSEGIEIDDAISMELRNRGVDALCRNDIDETLDVAKDIVGEILGKDAISLDMIDLRTFDDYTYRHSVNVAVLAVIIGMSMEMDEVKLQQLCVAAIFHDLGKMRIDTTILNKPARLTKEEFKVIKNHPQLSVDMLKERWNVSSASRVGILFHHENEDGSGYPNGLEGEEIHIFAKIIHVADVYDALTSKRPYKDPYTPSEAIEYLMGGCNILFNTEIVQSFLKSVPVYPKGSKVVLSDGREGIIFENNGTPLRPKVRLRTGELIDLSDNKRYLDVTINPISFVETDYSNEMAALSGDKNGRKVVLVVDDMVTNLQQVRSALEKDYKLIMVKSGQEALDYLNNHEHPQLIIMDIMLPGIDGVETVQKIQQDIAKDIPVIFLTALSDRETVMRCRAVGAVDYIVKPFRPLYILERVRAAIEGSDLCLME